MMLSVNLRLTAFQNSFHVFEIELLKGHLYNNYSLISDLLFSSIRFYIYITIFIDSATVAITIFNDSTTAWLSSHFSITISSDRTLFKNIQFLTPTKFVERHFMLPNEMKGSLLQNIIDIVIQSFHKVTSTGAVASSGETSE